MKKRGRRQLPLCGICVGFLNGLFGSGGGMIAVPFLCSSGLDEKKAHASSIGILFALSVISAGLYLWRGSVALSDALPYLPGALAGCFVGSKLMPKLSVKWLKRIFALLMIYGGIRMVMG